MSKGLVLVTGFNGFVGTSVALAYLEAGYNVRGTCRTKSKAEDWIAMFPQYKSKFEYAIVEDFVTPHCFDEAVKGVDFIAHTASPFSYNLKDNEKDMLQPAIAGTRNVVTATKLEPKIKRVVLTSSFASVLNFAIAPGVGKVYTDDDWNPATYDSAKNSPNPAYVYCTSKVLAERAFWEFIDTEKPSWAGSVICPSMIYGPPQQKITSLSALNISTEDTWNVVNGSYKNGVPPTNVPAFVDVRDVALAHVRATERDEAKGQRYLLISEAYKNEQIVDIVARTHPELADRLPKVDMSKVTHDDHFSYDCSKVKKHLGIEFISLEKCIKDTADKLVQLEKELSK